MATDGNKYKDSTRMTRIRASLPLNKLPLLRIDPSLDPVTNEKTCYYWALG